jgi:hypothetical protein
VERSFVPIERMAPSLPPTVIASEDGRFCTHRGIDWREIRERLEDVDEISAARAVSTITQQTAKNLFLWPGRSLLRKALELPLALWIDLVLPKWRVLEIYLNIAEWGPNGQFGAEVGSRYAFSKSVRRRCWLRCCRTRAGAAPSSRGRRCAGSPPSTRLAARPRPRSGSVRNPPSEAKRAACSRALALRRAIHYKRRVQNAIGVKLIRLEAG